MVAHVLTILAVPDVDEATRFYDAAFGWTKTVSVPVYVEYLLDGGQRIGLYDREAFAANTGATPSITPEGRLSPTELYFHVDDIEAAVDRLVRAGARILSPLAARAWGDEAAYFADPVGNVLVLARPSKSG